ncbi:MAG: PcfJ domain-containing protein [Clostridiales bacterium]|nr:PcfJ domain-containing protein [Clostridiales bacterium]
MDKRKLSAIPREQATEEMLQMADRLDGLNHIVTARMVEDDKILLLNFYRISKLKKGDLKAELRTFLSAEDYITQDLETEKVKWLTGGFDNLDGITLLGYSWDNKKDTWTHYNKVYIWTAGEKQLIQDFFKEYARENDTHIPWNAVLRFQNKVRNTRLRTRHQKELAATDAVMDPIGEAPQEFFDWVWENGMSFSRYLIYKETQRGKAECECTHCKKIGIVDRKDIRLRNNEKGVCPFCGSKVTIKAKGRLPYTMRDERWFIYVDPMQEGFMLRYFHAIRMIKNDQRRLSDLVNRDRVEESIHEWSRAVYTFPDGKPKCVDYDWVPYKHRGPSRWCPGVDAFDCLMSILYPGNLPQAWEHTPMKYSALEILSENIPTTAAAYEGGIKKYLEFPKLEWLCKMGLNRLAAQVMRSSSYWYSCSGVNYNGDTIYQILGLDKVNVKLLQAIDGTSEHLRLLQAAQKSGIRFTPESLEAYYEEFGANTNILLQANRHATLHKIVKYIAKESETYPLGGCGTQWSYSYNRYNERPDPRIERKQNMANDWLEYLKWCEKLGYDLDNMFYYMPTNFKKVHDRTAKEYQAMQDRKARAERKRQERLAKKRMEETKKAMAEIFSTNDGTDAFSIKGKGLIIVVPKSGDEIKAEGEALHHCVATYVGRVAEGKTSIFFARKAEEPDTPYFTMEYQGRVVQCRGMNNCGMPPEVQAFVNVFEKKMKEAAKKKEQPSRKAG